jgi:hypothetical protein
METVCGRRDHCRRTRSVSESLHEALDWDEVRTFELCHMYQRATKLVSNVAPIYYADLAATQAHYMISDFRDDEILQFDARSVGSHGSGGGHSTASSADFIGVSPKLAQKLFMV